MYAAAHKNFCMLRLPCLFAVNGKSYKSKHSENLKGDAHPVPADTGGAGLSDVNRTALFQLCCKNRI